MIDFHLSSERQEWCIMELLSFGLYLFSLVFLCFHAFPVTVSVGFLSTFVSFCWSRFFFLSCFSSCCIYILSSFCFPPASILFIRWFRFPVWFCVLERSQKRRHNSRQAAWHEPGPTKAKTKAKATVASSSTFVASTSHSHSTNPGTSWHWFLQFLPLLLPLARNDDCRYRTYIYCEGLVETLVKTKATL